MVGVYIFIFVAVEDKLSVQTHSYYGSQKPIYINGNFAGVYEPITQELRVATLKDKLYYGEIK